MWIGIVVGPGGMLLGGLVWWLIFRAALRYPNSAKNGNEFAPENSQSSGVSW